LTDSANSDLPRQEPFLRLQSVMVYVRNLDRSLEFYLDLLGFQIVFDGRSQLGKPGSHGWWSLRLTASQLNLDRATHGLRTVQTNWPRIPRNLRHRRRACKIREWSKRGVHFLSNPRLRRFKHALQLKPSLSNDAGAPDDHAPPIWGAVFSAFGIRWQHIFACQL